MASKKVVLFFILFFLAIGLFIAYLVNKDDEETTTTTTQIETYPTYLELLDSNTKTFVEGEYFIIFNNTIILTGKTSTQGLERIDVPLNFTILKVYINAFGYYSELRDINAVKTTISLDKLSELKVSHSGKLENENNLIKYFVEAGDTAREVSFCVAWSQNILEVNSLQFQDVKIFDNSSVLPPAFLDFRTDKCYVARKNLKAGEQWILELYYSLYGSISDRDYIKVYFIDSDLDSSGKYVFESTNKTDVGLITKEYIVIK